MEVEVYKLQRLSWCSLIFTNTKTLQLYRSLKKNQRHGELDVGFHNANKYFGKLFFVSLQQND